jgi:hypothetical protein
MITLITNLKSPILIREKIVHIKKNYIANCGKVIFSLQRYYNFVNVCAA